MKIIKSHDFIYPVMLYISENTSSRLQLMKPFAFKNKKARVSQSGTEEGFLFCAFNYTIL